MKKLILITFLGLSMLYSASYEVRTGDGYRVPTRTVYGDFTSRYESHFPYVCYDRRVKSVEYGKVYVRYEGCKRFNRSCESLGRVHFGRYPNDYASNKAYYRCLNARPKFID